MPLVNAKLTDKCYDISYFYAELLAIFENLIKAQFDDSRP